MRGQYSIDFFIVLSMVIAFSVLLYNVAVDEVGRTKVLDSAILGRHFLDEFSLGVDEAAIGGNQSRTHRELFVPKNVHCLFFNAGENAFYCLVSSSYMDGGKNRLPGRRLLSTPDVKLECEVTEGWRRFGFYNNGTTVVVTCG
ncbi:hypothetical protein HZC09_04475 [Candidatus Micrarchaeota archaeon]|nr:hypothetical protein [Candidatus Micrarchaeota archaeon]